ncbi:MAG: FAD-dependent oxidoreductase [Nocardioidaceae bacterium]
MDPIVVVGAGISGVACARTLADAALPVVVLDRGHRPGGRMASPRTHGRPVDTGASYLTATDEAFVAVVEDWERRGLARRWTDTFHVLAPGEPPATKAGPLRWGAALGLRSLVADLADGLEVELVTDVTAVTDRLGLAVDGRPATAVVLAMPDQQARRLLGADLAPVRDALDRESEPVLALTAWWGARGWELDGAFVNGDDDLAWVADDGRRRGDDAPVLVAHSTPTLAAAHLEDPQSAAPAMTAALRRLLDLPEPLGTRLHRWSLARPTGRREAPYLLDERLVGACGDGWGPIPKVEGAYLSGRALGRALADRLGRA